MKKNILVVDDSSSIYLPLKELLENISEFNVIIANSKEQCNNILQNKENKIDVALLDLGLPDAPNGEVVDLVEKFNIPIIVLTGSINKENIFRDKKIVDYVIKDGRFSFLYAVSLVKRVIKNVNIKVLVCSDDLALGNDVTKLLKQYRLNCLFSSNLTKAKDILDDNKDIKILILNENNNNIDFIKNVRTRYNKELLHILVLSEYENRINSVKLLKYGLNHIIYKDFTSEEFLSQIKAQLDSLEYYDNMFNKANKDFLTGAYNRRYFFTEVKKRFKKEANIKLFMLDIDKFKNINDTYGHDIGDIAIKEVINILNNQLKDIDCIISRFGGEEFCVIFFNIDDDIFISKLESIRNKFENNIIEIDNDRISYTVSIGYTLNKLDNIDLMINKADGGLYKAKNSGRNQVRNES